MQTALHPALAANVLAPASPKPGYGAAMHYAFSSWTPGAWAVLAIIIVVLAVAGVAAGKFRGSQG